MSMTWWNCVRKPSLALDPLGPVNDQTVAGAAEVGGDLLGPLKGRVHRPGPADGNMRVGGRAADFVELGLESLQSQLDAVEAGDLADRSLEAAFGRGAVVADDVEDQRVVQLPRGLEGGDEPADLLVGVVQEAGVVFHQAAVDPSWRSRADRPRPGFLWAAA